MSVIIRSLAIMISFAALAACDLPRGAALSSEILKERDAENPDFQVVEVNKAILDNVNGWPRASATSGRGWLPAARGPESQIIRSNDLVSVTIWDNEPNSLLTPVGSKSITLPAMVVAADGTIFLPYVEKVVVRGQTPDAARETVQSAFSEIAPSAQVQLSVQQGQGNAVDVVSGVAKPGTYPLPDRNSTILSVIAQAGGMLHGMRNPLVRLIRDDKTYEISAERLMSDANLNTVLRGRDKVVVEEDRRYFTALGATGSERLVPFEKASISALEAMSIIGGLSDSRADPKGVLILREYSQAQVRQDGGGPNNTRVVFTFDLTTAEGLFAARGFQVAHKDTVLATESPVVAAGTILGLLGSAFNVANAGNRAVN
ncbi:polysaccharide biosynthesis/export family protein [Thioclava sp. FR2]|uniref:polysaccharide biosynthesis/export family protein n=1 Tax=Thioclava sp. FR2 TaxID=3445780 RepID=UPI003EC0266D